MTPHKQYMSNTKDNNTTGRRPFDRLRRWWQRKGFGIESKTDFAFLHDIILEQWPYYAYREWQEQYPTAPAQEHRRAQLLFRLCNHLQPSAVSIHGNATPLTVNALRQACRKATVQATDAPYIKLSAADITAKLNGGMIIEYTANAADGDITAAIVLTDIKEGNAALWQQLTTMSAITYDMRHEGIALFTKKRYPEHYFI